MSRFNLETCSPELRERIMLAKNNVVAPPKPPAIVVPPKPKKPRAKTLVVPQKTESKIQQEIIRWWDLECRRFHLLPEDLMAFPLQGARTPANAARMKAEGMRRGTPDMFLAVGRHGYGGLWLELKRPGGRPTEFQTAALSRLQKQGYVARLVIGFDEATEAIFNYLAESQ